jgi:hypothetical protein
VAPLRDVLTARPLRRRQTVRVATPKGVLRELPVPTQAYTPEQAVEVLGTLSDYLTAAEDDGRDGHDGHDGLGPDAVWFIRFHDFLRDVVRAGRVMVRMHFEDGQWFPVWCLSSAGDHNRTLHGFEVSAPAVLTVNGGPGNWSTGCACGCSGNPATTRTTTWSGPSSRGTPTGG